MDIAIYICLAFMLAFGVVSIMSNRLITAGIALAVTSAASGVLMYILGATSGPRYLKFPYVPGL